MKILAIALMTVALPAVCLAVVDPDPDLMGIYFDTRADNDCLQVEAGTPFPAYVILTNPTFAGVDAFEFGYENEFDSSHLGSLVLMGATLPPQSIDVGSGDATGGDHIVGLASPVPPATALVLLTWQYMMLEKFPVAMYLGPTSTPSLPEGLPVVGLGGDLFAVDILSHNVNLPVAAVNGACGQIDEVQWGTLKSTFR